MEISRSFQRTFRIPARSARNTPFGAPGGFPRIPFWIFCARAGNPAPETFVFPLLLRFPENSMNSRIFPERFLRTNPVTANQEIAKGVEIQTFLETDFRVRRRQEPSREFSGTPREPQGRFQDPFRADPKVFKYHWFYSVHPLFFSLPGVARFPKSI